ncbi:glucose-6-phosphate dehydrogenase assembly protein OpcA [Actinoallomurus rhizosphaericola]|uniref:glucose-6-phosphate dehydrogenase assembly protein OpcA n=1 Tax=Actinoallomurus rhizosphaericola TaxID=2952536 RepID=UPI002092F03B|nr:glucose-6-phosphate dehydrogenase assembly protein OpcA [Actinoallomurus rhizosphaericola]MCO5999368.1 glucose-6-phosphate dehydrogenase assembly protein OpcA [Actinoallomurus rhizosphaericola]
MNIDLTNTTTRKVLDALSAARHRMGGPATGKVLTLVVLTEEASQYDAVRASTEAAREHPCRIIVVIARSPGGESRLDAEVRVGETGPGETVVLRLYGQLIEHADSVVLPLLVPDTPVVAWWPGIAPDRPAEEPLGALAQRRVTDAKGGSDPLGTLNRLAEAYVPGDTDFAWTRITGWRTLLAATLDQPHDDITGACVEADPKNPSAALLAAWLSVRLAVPCTVAESHGPGITGVRLTTTAGDIAITRPDGRVATLSRPEQPDRQVALHRRPTSELLAEELRRLDPDEVYRDAVLRFAKGLGEPAEAKEPAAAKEAGGEVKETPEDAAAPAKAPRGGRGKKS